jgi:uncharacterized membrane protein YhaH (DUF805 family)
MTQNHEGGSQPRQYSVWSDLRAMKFLSQVQDEMRLLKSAHSRLQFWMAIAIVLLGGVTIALTVGLILTYNQLQEVQRQIQPSQTSSMIIHLSYFNC